MYKLWYVLWRPNDASFRYLIQLPQPWSFCPTMCALQVISCNTFTLFSCLSLFLKVLSLVLSFQTLYKKILVKTHMKHISKSTIIIRLWEDLTLPSLTPAIVYRFCSLAVALLPLLYTLLLSPISSGCQGGLWGVNPNPFIGLCNYEYIVMPRSPP